MASGREATRRQFISASLPTGDARAATDDPAQELRAAAAAPYLVRYARPAMATDFQLFLIAGRDEHGAEAALAALDVVDEVETQLTVYRATSEVVELNRRAARDAVVVEPRLFALIEQAVMLHQATDGAFDITSAPLTRAWSAARRQGRIPTDDELVQARAGVGSHNVLLDREARSIRFAHPNTEINFHAIGKGYALDRCREVLTGFGVGEFLLHGGRSSVLAGGAAGGDAAAPRGWTIGIGHPLRPERRLAELFVADRAVGTSGAGFQFFRHGGKRYGHILDPRTGLPADGVFSVTVTAPTAAEADALATAFYVNGCAAAEAFCAARPDVGFLMLLPAAGGGAIELISCNLDDDSWRTIR